MALPAPVSGRAPADVSESEWAIYIMNDNCPDYTWGLTERQTRQALADIVKGHLDEMRRTDGAALENRELPFVANTIAVDLRPNGYCAVRLSP